MKWKLPILVTTTLLLILPAWPMSAETVVVRDRSGKIIKKRITRGDRTEVRSATGKLIRIEIIRGDRKDIRTPTGKPLRTEKIK